MTTPLNNMKTIATLVTVGALAVASTSCMTTYDAAGRPVQSVDPGAAAAGAVAAGALGYAIGQNNNDRDVYYGRGYYRHRGGYYRHRGHWHH
jgi:hypothetical protein